MIKTDAHLDLSIIASLFALGAIVCFLRFRKRVRRERSLSDKREFDFYVPYNMLACAISCFNYPKVRGGTFFPDDKEKNGAVRQEIKKSWFISPMLIKIMTFAIAATFLVLLSYIHR